MSVLGASSIGDLLNPLFQALSGLIAFFYSLIPNYAIAIALLTLTVMIVLSPLTIKSTRSMIAMQRLAPEMKKLQQKYKGDRQRLNEEMMAFYKENNVSPLGGCLPLILQAPLLFIMYDVIRGLTNMSLKHQVLVDGHLIASQQLHLVPDPKYISHTTRLYNDLVASGGHMFSFGVDLSRSATAHHSSFAAALPYWAIIIAAIGLQYLQMRQLNGRNPQMAAANPQAMMIQKYMPLVFGFIYIGIPAGVNVYFVVSSLFRIGQQELMFRYDPKLKQIRSGAIPARAKEIDPGERGTSPPRRESWLSKILAPPSDATPSEVEEEVAEPEELSGEGGNGPPSGKRPTGGRELGRPEGERADEGNAGPKPKARPAPKAGGSNGRPSGNGSRRQGASNGSGGNGRKPAHPRSQSKRRRKAR